MMMTPSFIFENSAEEIMCLVEGLFGQIDNWWLGFEFGRIDVAQKKGKGLVFIAVAGSRKNILMTRRLGEY